MIDEIRFPVQNEIANPSVFMGTIQVRPKYDTNQYSSTEFTKQKIEGMQILERLKLEFETEQK